MAQHIETEALDDNNPSFAVEFDEEPSHTRYIVKYKPGSKEFQVRMHGARRRNLRRTTASSSRDDTFLTYGSFLPKDNAEVVYMSEEELKEWEKKEDVEYIEPDSKVYPMGWPWTEEWIPYGIDQVHALDVPDHLVSNRKICIIDSGYDLSHPDLPKDTVTGYEGELSAPGGWSVDRSGHGTHVAGTIAALGGNNQGVAGVIRNGEVNIHIVKVFDDEGQWAWRSYLVSAVEECVDNGANVINMSLGGPYPSDFEASVYRRVLNEDNILPVAAAGNGQGGLSMYQYPAAYPDVMAVAATNRDYTVAPFSTRNDQVNIAAPGRYVMSTLPWSVLPNMWGTYSGTSMACPHVVGIAALVWSHDTSKSAKYIRELLQGTADDIGEPGRDHLFGHGFVRADKALEFLKGEANYTFEPTPTPTDPREGYCNHRNCEDGLATGGEWCNMNENQCKVECAGTWCWKESDGYCSDKATGCNGDAFPGWCGESEEQCTGACDGLWCYNAMNPTPSPTDMPTISTSPSAIPSISLLPSVVPSMKPSMEPTFTSMPSSKPSPAPSTLSPTEELDGYCNYNGCDGITSGGSWCNEGRSRCTSASCNGGTWCPKSEGYCTWGQTGCNGEAWTGWCGDSIQNCDACDGGLWCWNEANKPLTDMPTTAPTSSSHPSLTPSTTPSTTPSMKPTAKDTSTSQPSHVPSQDPSTLPTAQPTSCSDDPDNSFFFNFKDDGTPVYKTCSFLATKDDAEINFICKNNIDSYDGVGPAKDVCREMCGTCPTLSPTNLPSNEPSNTPSSKPSNVPSNVSSTAPTSSPTSEACCSQDYKTCGGDAITEWCKESESNCNSCGGVIIIPPKEECIAKWGVCTDNVDGCCLPGVCQGNEFWKQCQ